MMWCWCGEDEINAQRNPCTLRRKGQFQKGIIRISGLRSMLGCRPYQISCRNSLHLRQELGYSNPHLRKHRNSIRRRERGGLIYGARIIMLGLLGLSRRVRLWPVACGGGTADCYAPQMHACRLRCAAFSSELNSRPSGEGLV